MCVCKHLSVLIFYIILSLLTDSLFFFSYSYYIINNINKIEEKEKRNEIKFACFIQRKKN
jgi:hypothetical protein